MTFSLNETQRGYAAALRDDPLGLPGLRAAGKVLRWHTGPHGASQTVAAHSWGVAVLIDQLFPNDASANLLRAALYHDVAEYQTGDIPAPAKWGMLSATLADLHALELGTEIKLGVHVVLSDEEARVLKIADQLELMVTCLEEVRRGNVPFVRPFWRVAANLEKLAVDGLAGRYLQGMVDEMHNCYAPQTYMMGRPERSF